jgi:hypothetical protein
LTTQFDGAPYCKSQAATEIYIFLSTGLPGVVLFVLFEEAQRRSIHADENKDRSGVNAGQRRFR